MEQIKQIDIEYKEWVKELSKRYKQSQIKAAVKVNRELLLFYWSLGKDIARLKAESKWGTGFVKNLSRDLQELIPDVKGFSQTNIFYIIKFYTLYSGLEKFPQLEGKLENSHELPADAEDDFQLLFRIPWGHHKVIMDKCKEDPDKAVFFVKKTLENDWSRAVLLNFIDTNLYERQGKAVTNFRLTLPDIQSDLAQEMTKDPYNFDFLTMTEGYYEKELKDALMDNITNFLLELGTGFAFVGREYRLVVGETEQFLDMLFYNINLHCYVVIEVKVRPFDPRDMGQIGTYVAAVNGILRKDGDSPTIGLLICKTKDNVLAQYAANSSKEPIGVSEYQLSEIMPEDFKGSLPTIEEIENKLRD